MRVPGRGFLDTYPADLVEWQNDERLVRRGFVHAWRSQVAPGSGEAFFDALVRSLVRPGAVVADIGCGHGGYAQTLAPLCRQVIGIDGDPDVIDLARELAVERGMPDLAFHVLRLGGAAGSGGNAAASGEIDVDSGVREADGGADHGLPESSVDVFVCRRGPVLAKWLDLAIRSARPGAVAVGMHPTGAAGAVPPWNADLPQRLRIEGVFGYDEVRAWVTAGIEKAPERVRLEGCWWFDVTETFDEPTELYARLSGRRHDVPPWPAVKDDVTRLFTAHGGTLELRHCRLVWQASFR